MKKHRNSLVVAALLFSATTSAGMPMKIVPDGKSAITGTTYFQNFTLQCGDQESLALTSWNHGKKWCIGKQSNERCFKTQIRCAKFACKLTSK